MNPGNLTNYPDSLHIFERRGGAVGRREIYEKSEKNIYHFPSHNYILKARLKTYLKSKNFFEKITNDLHRSHTFF